jgi:hypothetical protein
MLDNKMTAEENALYDELCFMIASKGFAGNAHVGIEAVRDAANNEHDRLDELKTLLVHAATPDGLPYVRTIYKVLRDRGATNVNTILTWEAMQIAGSIQTARNCKPGELRNPWSLNGETTRDMIHYALTSEHADLVLTIIREHNPYSLGQIKDAMDERLNIQPCLREGAL